MRMSKFDKGALFLGLAFLLFAILVVFVWVPLDTESGLLQKVRRRWLIGDALAPSVAGLMIAVGACAQIFEGVTGAQRRQCAGQHIPTPAGGLTSANLGFALCALLVLLASFQIMRWFGPAAVALLGEQFGIEASYRALRDTVPWKYLGYVAGGFVLILASVVAVERRLSLRALLLAILAPLVIAMLYDLPFDDLLLPPNGDL